MIVLVCVCPETESLNPDRPRTCYAAENNVEFLILLLMSRHTELSCGIHHNTHFMSY